MLMELAENLIELGIKNNEISPKATPLEAKAANEAVTNNMKPNARE